MQKTLNEPHPEHHINFLRTIYTHIAVLPKHVPHHHSDSTIKESLEKNLIRIIQTPYGTAYTITTEGRKAIGIKNKSYGYAYEKILDRLYLTQGLEQLLSKPEVTLVRSHHPPIITIKDQTYRVYGIHRGYKMRTIRHIANKQKTELMLYRQRLLFLMPTAHFTKSIMTKQKPSKYGPLVAFYTYTQPV